jgi:hypothetical protein
VIVDISKCKVPSVFNQILVYSITPQATRAPYSTGRADLRFRDITDPTPYDVPHAAHRACSEAM